MRIDEDAFTTLGNRNADHTARVNRNTGTGARSRARNTVSLDEQIKMTLFIKSRVPLQPQLTVDHTRWRDPPADASSSILGRP